MTKNQAKREVEKIRSEQERFDKIQREKAARASELRWNGEADLFGPVPSVQPRTFPQYIESLGSTVEVEVWEATFGREKHYFSRDEKDLAVAWAFGKQAEWQTANGERLSRDRLRAKLLVAKDRLMECCKVLCNDVFAPQFSTDLEAALKLVNDVLGKLDK